jgi:hypothetical protein
MRWGKLAAGTLVLASITGVALGMHPAEAETTSGSAPLAAQVRPWPITLTVRTVPVLPGITFTFDGWLLTTNAQGAASITEQHNFAEHTLSLLSRGIVRSGRHYQFARWAGQRDPELAFRRTVTRLPMRRSYTITAGFNTACPVTPRFVTQHGDRVDPNRVGQVVLQSSTGQRVQLAPDRTSWVACARPVDRDTSLFSVGARYSVQRIVISGANIVRAGAERFAPQTNARPTFVGYFHRLTISAHDALFGGKTGTVAMLRLPDGSVQRATLGADHAITLDLPQGQYGLNVQVGGSIVLSEHLRLSRDKTVDFTAVSHGDLLSIAAAVLVTGAGLPLLSKVRRKRLRQLLRLRPGAHTQ